MAKEVRLKSDDISLRGVQVATLNRAIQFEWRASSRPPTRADYTRK